MEKFSELRDSPVEQLVHHCDFQKFDSMESGFEQSRSDGQDLSLVAAPARTDFKNASYLQVTNIAARKSFRALKSPVMSYRHLRPESEMHMSHCQCIQ